MSKTVDERVVEMRFDNEQFERNAGKSISTLAKLKQALKLSGASDGLDNISKSAKNVDLSGIATSVSSLEKRFSTLGIVGMRVIENLTDKMMSLGGRAVSFFTNGIVQGGITRATNLENAHFQLQGLLKDEAAVQAVMQNVKDSVDGTAYSLDAAAKVASQLAASGMTAGEDMYKSLRAVAGVAAMTNSSYEDIGMIFTTVAGNGRLMGDQLLQLSSRGMNAAATLAEYLGKTESEVREMVSDGKISFQTFADAMDDAFGEHAKKANETFSGAMANVKSALGRIGADFVAPLIEQNGPLVQFFNTLRERVNELHNSLGPLTEKVTNFATKAIGSATEALKNFSPSMDSKWNKFIEQINSAGIETETFQEKLKECAKSHNVNLDKMIEKEGSFGKAVIEAFRNGDLDKSVISETLRSITGEITETTTAAGTMADKIEEYGDIVNQVIRGDFGDAPERFERLTEAGYDYATIQNLVNEQLGSNVRHISELTEEQLKNADALSTLSDEELKNKGYTEDQIKAINELADAAEKAGTPISELIESLDHPSGFALVFDGLKNIFGSIGKSLKSIGAAWKEIFNNGKTSSQLYSIAEGFNNLTKHFILSDEKADKLKRTFKGLFAIFDIVKTVVLELGKSVFKGLSNALGLVDLDILGVTANIGDMLVKFRGWVVDGGKIEKAFEKVSNAIGKTIGFVKNAVKAFSELPAVQKIVAFFRDDVTDAFGKVIKSVGDFIKGIKDGSITFNDIFEWMKNGLMNFVSYLRELKLSDIIDKFRSFGENIVDGFNGGVRDKISSIVNIMLEFAKKIVDTVEDFLGIHSPSKVFIYIGAMIVAGLVAGVLDNIPSVHQAFESIKNAAGEVFKNVDWSKLLAVGSIVGILVIVNKLIDAFNTISSPIKGVGDVLSGVGKILDNVAGVIEYSKKSIKKVVKSVANMFNAFAFKNSAAAIKDIAISIAILVGSLALLTQLDTGKVNTAIKQLVVLAGLLAGLSAVVGMTGKGVNFAKFGVAVLGIASAIFVMSRALKMIATLDPERVNQAMISISTMGLMLISIVAAYSIFTGKSSDKNINQAAKMLTKIAGSLLIMAVVVKLLGQMKPEKLAKGLVAIECLALIVIELIAITKLSGGEVKGIGKTLLAISGAMAILVVVIKMISRLKPGAIAKGLVTMSLLGLIIAELIAVTNLAGKDKGKIGGSLLAMASSMAILVLVIKMIGGIDAGTLLKGVIVMQFFALVIAELVAATRLAGKNSGKIGATILSMSVSIAILAAVAILLGMIDLKSLAKGITAVGLLSAFMTAMIWATKSAKDCKKNLIVMTVAIGIMAASIVALSFLDPKSIITATGCMSALMGIFALIIKASGSAKGSMKSLIIMTSAIGIMAGVLYLLAQLPIENTINIAASISMLLGSMALVLAAMNKTGSLSASAIGSLVLMGLVVLELGGILALLSQFDISTSYETVSQISLLMVAMSAALLIASNAGKNSVGAAAAMVIMGAVVAEIGIVLGLLSGLDISVSLETVASLSVLLLAMSAALGILSVMQVNIASGINAGTALATFVGIMAGVIAAFGGLSKIDGFTELMKDGGEALAAVGYAIGDFVGSIIGGLGEGITSGLPAMGENISNFVTNLATGFKEMGSIDTSVTDGIKNLAEAILLITAADVLQGITGFLTGAIFGGQDTGTAIQAFCNQLQPLGEGIKSFSDAVQGVDTESTSVASEALGNIIAAVKKIPTSGGVKGIFGGEIDLSSFKDQLQPLGEGIKAFSDAVQGISGYSEDIQSSVTIIEKLVGVINSLSGIDASGVSTFVNAIDNLSATNVSGFASNFADSAEFSTAGITMMENLASGLKSGESKLNSAINNALTTLTNAIKDKYKTMQSCGERIAEYLSTGMKNKVKQIESAGKTMASKAVSAVRSQYSSFKTAGAYLGSGLVVGINSKKQAVYNAGYALGQKAVQGEKDGQKSKSPSKLTIQAGKWLGEGLVIGIGKMVSKAYDAGKALGSTTSDAVASSLSGIAAMMDGSIDMQPTIRPVLDLGSVSDGVDSINSMLDLTPSLGLMSNMGNINSLVNRRNQNGTNDDVVSAIKGLSKQLGKTGNTYNSINGITYDDGSNISDAVKTLIRAANIERRR